jgi:hypothetical protein
MGQRTAASATDRLGSKREKREPALRKNTVCGTTESVIRRPAPANYWPTNAVTNRAEKSLNPAQTCAFPHTKSVRLAESDLACLGVFTSSRHHSLQGHIEAKKHFGVQRNTLYSAMYLPFTCPCTTASLSALITDQSHPSLLPPFLVLHTTLTTGRRRMQGWLKLS